MNAVEHHQPLQTYLDSAVPAEADVRSGPELAIIVPTFNERDNIAELIGRLAACLGNRSWEVVFVDDDSPDGTADLVRELRTGAYEPVDFRPRRKPVPQAVPVEVK